MGRKVNRAGDKPAPQESYDDGEGLGAPAKRRYDSSRRQAQAAETRTAILESARALFTERGYAGTTIKAVADGAGVAEETVYAAFGSKRDLMNGLVRVAVLGDPPVPFPERPEIQAVIRERDQRRQVERFADAMAPVLDGSAALWRVMRAAEMSEPELAALVRQSMHGRLAGMGEFVDALLANGPLRPDVTPQYAREVVWTLASPETFQLLRADLGWSDRRYRRWLTDSLVRILLP